MREYALDEGVPVGKSSLGFPGYAGWWYPGYNEARGARVIGREISHQKATELLETYDPELVWLPGQGVSYAFWQNEGVFEWLFLEDRWSFEQQLEIYRSYPGLRGISVWVLGAEDPAIWESLSRERPR